MKTLFPLLLLVVLLLVRQEPTWAQPSPLRIATLKFVPMPQHGAPVIEIILNRTVTARFLIDTGATNTGITPDMVQRMKLPEESHPGGLNSTRLSYVEIGNWKVNGGNFLVLDGPVLPYLKSSKVDGILGLNFLNECALFVNFEKQECSFVLPGNLPKEEVERRGFTDQETSPVPLTLDQAKLFYFVEAQVGGNTVPLMLDTGHVKTVLPQTFSSAFGNNPVFERGIVGIAGIKKAPSYLISGINIGNAKGSKQIVTVAHEEVNSRGHILGMDFLAQFNLLIDFPSKRVYFHRLVQTNPSLDNNHQENIEGMILGIDKGIWKIVALDPRSRFFRAGLHQGDTIRTINGVDTDGLVNDQIAAEVARRPSSTFIIKRSSGREKQSLSILVAK